MIATLLSHESYHKRINNWEVADWCWLYVKLTIGHTTVMIYKFNLILTLRDIFGVQYPSRLVSHWEVNYTSRHRVRRVLRHNNKHVSAKFKLSSWSNDFRLTEWVKQSESHFTLTFMSHETCEWIHKFRIITLSAMHSLDSFRCWGQILNLEILPSHLISVEVQLIFLAFGCCW